MNEKKNIDRLFQEKFKDFEAVPREQMWHNIEAELKRKKKRRVIPLWYRLSGVAAIVLLGLLLVRPVLNGVDSDSDTNPAVVNEEAKGSEKISPVLKPVPANATVTDAGNAATPAKTENGNSTKSSEAQEHIINKTLPVNTFSNNSKDAVTHKSNSKNNSNINGKTKVQNKFVHPVNNNNAIVQENTSGKNKPSKIKTDENTPGNNTARVNKNISGINTEESEGFASHFNNKSSRVNESSKNSTSQQQEETNNPTVKIIKDENLIVHGTEIAKTDIDTTVVPQENELEKLLQEKLKGTDKEEEKEELAEAENKDKWGIRPQLAPVFYNSLSNGSPIDASLANNSKSFDNDLSYGVGIQYALNDRITLRSGVNTVNLSYSTGGIEFFPSLSKQTNNVTAARTANIVVQNQTTNTGTQTFVSDQASAQKFNGSMIQKMGYIEVPVEMSYALVNKRFGVEVIGGISTLFLNENNVSVVSSQGYGSNVGEASNLNDIHFSTNVGLGFKYRFWKSFQANFEPMFKYQVNTFSSGSGNFKPYFIGLYSGISFSF